MVTTPEREGGAPVLVGRLVRLEPLSVHHVPDLTMAAAEARDSFGFTTVPERSEQVADYVRGRMASDEHMPFAQVRIADGHAVGCTSFLAFRRWPGDDDLYAVEIGGTWLAASAQRSGINTEAKLLLLRHAFDEWQVGGSTSRRTHGTNNLADRSSGSGLSLRGCCATASRRMPETRRASFGIRPSIRSWLPSGLQLPGRSRRGSSDSRTRSTSTSGT